MKLNLKPSEIKRYRKNNKLLGSQVWKNPVSRLGMDLPFLVVTSISLRAAAAISIQMAMVHLGTVVAAILLCRVLPRWSRPLVYPAVSTAIMLVAWVWLSSVFPVVTGMMGMYIYLMAVNSMTFAAAMSIEREDKIYPVALRAVKCLAGFVVLIFAVSLVREYFGSGAVWSRTVPHIISLDGLHVPFFGFILLGFLLAGLRAGGKVVQAAALTEQERRDAVYMEDEG